jgi:hypothetical protein
MWDLGERAKVAILSVTEGEDKPLKYPDMFAAASLMVLNKTDLLPHVDFDVSAASTTRGASTRASRCCRCRRAPATAWTPGSTGWKRRWPRRSVRGRCGRRCAAAPHRRTRSPLRAAWGSKRTVSAHGLAACPPPRPRRVLACGAYLKNAACLLDGSALRWSPLHGDLGDPSLLSRWKPRRPAARRAAGAGRSGRARPAP